MKKKIIIFAPIIIGITLILISGASKKISVFDKGEVKTLASSTLTDAIDISELSTAQFTYNGITELYKDKKHEKVWCYVRYNAKVKAGVDMKSVKFEIDETNKTVKPILPQIRITVNTVDEKSLSFIPTNVTVGLKEALVACQDDAAREAKESQELLSSAKDNLKSIIEALLYPILNPQGYSIVWN